MNGSLTFSRHFSRLVWLLAHEPGNIPAQKDALRSVVAASQQGAVTLALRDDRLHANAQASPEPLTGVRETAARLAVHGVREMIVNAGAAAADLLVAARALAAAPDASEPGAGVERVQDLDLRTVRFTLLAPVAPAPTPAAAAPTVSPPPAPKAAERRLAVAERAAGARLDIVTDDADGMFRHFASPQLPRGSVEDLLARLDGATHGDQITAALDDLVTVAENAALDGRSATIAEALWGITIREQALTDAARKRMYALALRRLSRPALLRAVVALLPERRDRTEAYVAVLVRAGEDGADAVIEHLTQAQAIGDRRVFFDVLRRLQAGVPTLIHMLGDARWFVVRNAAELLGEMRAVEAEERLVELLHHGDTRVRRSAARALLQLGSRSASRAVHDAMRDQSPEVRAQIAGAIAARPDAQSVITLTRALDDEGDTEVQLALIDALGRVGSREAVRRLAGIAAPEGRLFRRKPNALRLAAVQALGETRTPDALDVLRGLAKDRDRAVRDAVASALARVRATAR